MAFRIGMGMFWCVVWSMVLFCNIHARPKSFEDHEEEKVMDELKELSSMLSFIDMPVDNTPKGPEDEDEESSGTGVGDAECRGEIKPRNTKSNETVQDPPDLIHANYDTLCQKVENGTIKKLPVYIVGMELKKFCGELNNIPYKRFKMENYLKRLPRFDIPGMCIPLKGKEMTLLMVDPDAPSRNSHRCRSWLHWMVVNIPKGNVSKGKEITYYKPPLPPVGSGPHRYFFLLYEQNYHIGNIDDSENNMHVRCGFNVRNFAEDNSLIGPVALNMFITERKRRSVATDDEDKDKTEGKKKDASKNEKDSENKNNKEKDVKDSKQKEETKKNTGKNEKDVRNKIEKEKDDKDKEEKEGKKKDAKKQPAKKDLI